MADSFDDIKILILLVLRSVILRHFAVMTGITGQYGSDLLGILLGTPVQLFVKSLDIQSQLNAFIQLDIVPAEVQTSEMLEKGFECSSHLCQTGWFEHSKNADLL